MRATVSSARSSLRRLRRLSFGLPAAVVTSIAVIVGLEAAHSDRVAIVGSLLILALADNLTDALGIHIYQESESLPEREAFRTTIANFLTRLLVALSFAALVVMITPPLSVCLAVIWGLLLLAALSYRLANARGVSPVAEILKHCIVALLVIALSGLIGESIPALLRRI